MKHAFSKGLMGSKFWRTCKKYALQKLFEHIFKQYTLGVIWDASTMVDCERISEVGITDTQINLIIIPTKE